MEQPGRPEFPACLHPAEDQLREAKIIRHADPRIQAKGQPCTNRAARGMYCRAHSFGGWRVSDGTVYPVAVTKIS